MRIAIVVLLVALAQAADKVKITEEYKPEKCERAAKNGDEVWIHFTGSVHDCGKCDKEGKVFDSSIGHDHPFKFVLGKGEVLPGWEQGMLGMCVGENRTLIVPPSLGYGAQGHLEVPGGATLSFSIEAIHVGDPANFFQDIDTTHGNKDGKLTQEEISAWFKAEGKNMPTDLWEKEDKDKDGFVSWQEFTGPKGVKEL